MYILTLDFKNAGWFYNQKFDDKDFVFDLNGQTNRKSFNKKYKEPITVYQISNVLHVLFGERPSASLRQTNIKPIQEIFNIANNSYLKIDNYFVENNGNKQFFNESLLTRKAVYNSYEKSKAPLYWKRIETYLGQSLFDNFVDVIKNVLNVDDHTKYTFIDTLKLIKKYHLQNPKIIKLLDDLKKNKKTPLYNTIIGDTVGVNKKTGEPSQLIWKNEEYVSNTDFNKHPSILLTTNFGISSIIRLYGKIIVPIPDDKWVTKLKNAPGVATILDGGIVTINDFKSEIYYSDADLFGFVKVSDISTELI